MKMIKLFTFVSAFVSAAFAGSMDGTISYLNVMNCCAEGLGGADGMIKGQLIKNNVYSTFYILPSAKNYKECLATLLSAYNSTAPVTIDFELNNGQPTISQFQKGGVSLGTLH